VAWNPLLQTLYIGCQNTSLQWFAFSQYDIIPCADFPTGSAGSIPGGPSRKAHKFFDSYPQYERRRADINAVNGTTTALMNLTDTDGCVQHTSVPGPKAFLQVSATNVIDSAHYGYIYCMALLPYTREGSDDPPISAGTTQLITGSGDETVKVTSHMNKKISRPDNTFSYGTAHYPVYL
jgi:di- and tripeptidase